MFVIPIELAFKHSYKPSVIYVPLSRDWWWTLPNEEDFDHRHPIITDKIIEPVSYIDYKKVKKIAKKQLGAAAERWHYECAVYSYALVHPPYVDLAFCISRLPDLRRQDPNENLLPWKHPTMDLLSQSGWCDNKHSLEEWCDRDYRLINNKTWIHVLDWEIYHDAPEYPYQISVRPWNRWMKPMPIGSRIHRGFIEFVYLIGNDIVCQQKVKFRLDGKKLTIKNGWRTIHYRLSRGIGVVPFTEMKSLPSPETIGFDTYKTGRYEETVEKLNKLLSWFLG